MSDVHDVSKIPCALETLICALVYVEFELRNSQRGQGMSPTASMQKHARAAPTARQQVLSIAGHDLSLCIFDIAGAVLSSKTHSMQN